MSKIKSTPIYGNWRMLGPGGELMCRCDGKRARWYLSRALADELPDQAFQLRFEPAGSGNAGDAFMLEAKANACVVCGAEEGLNRHHVVPYQYRRRMPLSWKERASYDVVPICVEHHEQYEALAQELAAEIGREHGAPFNHGKKLGPEVAAERKLLTRARLLLPEGPARGELPEARREELMAFVRASLGREPTEAALRELLAAGASARANPEEEHARAVVERLLAQGGEEALLAFVKRWRRHFVETMKPRRLSPSWVVDHVRA